MDRDRFDRLLWGVVAHGCECRWKRVMVGLFLLRSMLDFGTLVGGGLVSDGMVGIWKWEVFGIRLGYMRNWLTGMIRYWLFKRFRYFRSVWFGELLYRRLFVDGSCWEQGECVRCSCVIPHKLFQGGRCYCFGGWGWFERFLKELDRKVIDWELAYDVMFDSRTPVSLHELMLMVKGEV